MAPLVYAAELLRSSSDPVKTARELRNALDSANAQIAEYALALIPQSAAILIHSASATVESVLRTAHDRGRQVEIFATESLPGGEGHSIAAALLNYGIPAEVVSDRAISAVVARATLAFTGADWISPCYVTNKVGTAELCRVAREAGTPVYCLASRLKFLSSEPPSDPSGLFEPTPLDCFTAIVSDTGIHRARTAGK
jgi:translation initiation factor 2B subunit (eIF-2B alpha/beta/delta family)